MPSPVGHGLAAVAVGWGVAGLASAGTARWRQIAILSAIGAAPDLDLLVNRHSQFTHSVGAAVIVASVAAFQRWPVASSRVLIWVSVALAWLSHPWLDVLALDTSPPIGVMLFWPFSREHVQTGWSLFAAISRRWWLSTFWTTNALALAREIVILAPVVLGVWWYRTRGFSPRSRVQGPGSYPPYE